MGGIAEGSGVGPNRAFWAATWLAALACTITLPGAFAPFVFGKLLAMALAAAIGWFAASAGSLPRPAWIGMAVGAALLAAAALSGSAPLAQFFGRWPRYEGVLALGVYASALWLGARLFGPARAASGYRALTTGLSVAALFVGFWALLEAFGARPLGGAKGVRPSSLLGNATEQGMIGLILFAMLAGPAADAVRARARARREEGKTSSRLAGATALSVLFGPLAVAGAIAALATVVWSGSRAALLGTGVALVAILALRLARSPSDGAPSPRPARRRLVVAGVGSVAFLAAAALAFGPTRERLFATETITGREELWREALRLGADNIGLGVGPSGFLDAIVPYHTEHWAYDIGMSNPPDSPHSWPLQALAAGGVALALLAALAGGYLVVRGFRRWRAAESGSTLLRVPYCEGAIAALAGYGVALLTHFTAPGSTPLVALLAGGLIAARPKAPPVTRALSQATRWIGQTAAWLLVAVLAVSSIAEWTLGAAFRNYAKGDVGAADASFSAAAALRPWDADVPSQAAQAFAALASAGFDGAAPLAVGWGDRAIARLPDSIQAGLARAVGLAQSGRNDDALAALNALNARSPFDPKVLLQRGVVLRRAGDDAGARADFQQVLRLDPDNQAAARLLEETGS